MAEQVDVCIVGSGFGGSISAYRLSELYKAAGADPARILVLERGRRFKHTDFQQSMSIQNLSRIYNLVQASGGSPSTGPQGVQVVTANAVGGGSNLYLAASIRSPHETFERRDRRPGDGPSRRMWPHSQCRACCDVPPANTADSPIVQHVGQDRANCGTHRLQSRLVGWDKDRG